MVNLLNNILSEFHFDTNNTIIIAGAGISADSGLPVGLELTKRSLDFFNMTDHVIEVFKQINSSYIKPITDNKEIDLYSYPRLEAIFNIFKDCFSQDTFENIVTNLLYNNNCNINSNLYHKLLAEHIHNGGNVITTNFDKLIENAYKDLYHKELKDISVFPIKSSIDVNKTGKLLKIHGCMSNPKNIGVTLENLSLTGFKENERISLNNIFLRDSVKNLVFLGYSFSDTFDFIPYLSALKKQFNIFYFSYNQKEIYEDFKITSNLDSINDKETYKYVLNKRLNNIIEQKRIIFFNKNCFVKYFNEDWKSKNTFQVIQNNNNSIINKDSVEYSYSMLRLFYEFGLSENHLFNNKQMNVHKKRVLFSLTSKNSYKMKFYVLSCFLNRDRHSYFLHSLLHLLNIFFTFPNFLYSWAEFHGTITEWIYVAWQFPKNKPIIRYSKAFLFQTLGALVIFPSGLILLLLISFYRILGYYKHFSKKRKREYLFAKRQLYLPIFNLIKYLKLSKNIDTPHRILMTLNTLMNSCITTAMQLNDLKQYRYIRKELVYMPYFLKIKNKEDLKIDFNELLLFDADSDYFIEVRNVSSWKEAFYK